MARAKDLLLSSAFQEAPSVVKKKKKRNNFAVESSWGPSSKYCYSPPSSGLVCSDTVGEMQKDRLFPLFEAKKEIKMPFKYALNISGLLPWEPKSFLKSHWTQPENITELMWVFLFLGMASTHGLQPEDAMCQKAIYSPCWKRFFPKLLIPSSFPTCLHLTSLNIWDVSWEEKSLSPLSPSLHVKNMEQFSAQFIFLAQSGMIILFLSAGDGMRTR